MVASRLESLRRYMMTPYPDGSAIDLVGHAKHSRRQSGVGFGA